MIDNYCIYTLRGFDLDRRDSLSFSFSLSQILCLNLKIGKTKLCRKCLINQLIRDLITVFVRRKMSKGTFLREPHVKTDLRTPIGTVSHPTIVG